MAYPVNLPPNLPEKCRENRLSEVCDKNSPAMVTATKDGQEWDKSTQILIECLEIGDPKFNHQRNNLINHQQVYINTILFLIGVYSVQLTVGYAPTPAAVNITRKQKS